MEIFKKQILWLMLLGCMILPTKQIQTSSSSNNNSMRAYLFAGMQRLLSAENKDDEVINFPTTDPRMPGIDCNAELSEKEIIEYLEFKLTQIKASATINIHVLARKLLMSLYSYNKIDKLILKAQFIAYLKNITNIHRKPIVMKYIQKAWLKIEYGIGSFYDDNYTSAYHEAGHAVAFIYEQPKFRVIDSATIIPRFKILDMMTQNYSVKGIGGCVIAPYLLPNFNLMTQSIDQLKSDIVVLLAGGIAQQLYWPYEEIGYSGVVNSIKSPNLSKFLSYRRCTDDIDKARLCAKFILLQIKLAQLNVAVGNATMELATASQEYDVYKQNFDTLTEAQLAIDTIIANCYDFTWNFMSIHADEIEEVADLLIEKKTVSGDEIYNLLRKNKPLYDFESGPLPQSLAENYLLRGAYDVHPGDETMQIGVSGELESAV